MFTKTVNTITAPTPNTVLQCIRASFVREWGADHMDEETHESCEVTVRFEKPILKSRLFEKA